MASVRRNCCPRSRSMAWTCRWSVRRIAWCKARTARAPPTSFSPPPATRAQPRGASLASPTALRRVVRQVTRTAQPLDLERLAVVRVVHLRFSRTAPRARTARQLPALEVHLRHRSSVRATPRIALQAVRLAPFAHRCRRARPTATRFPSWQRSTAGTRGLAHGIDVTVKPTFHVADRDAGGGVVASRSPVSFGGWPNPPPGGLPSGRSRGQGDGPQAQGLGAKPGQRPAPRG